MIPVTKVEALRLWSQKITDGIMPGINPGTGRCQYRGETECAIGVLIPHDKMPSNCSFGIETKAMLNYCNEFGVHLDQLIEGFAVTDLGNIQDAHDDAAMHFLGDFRRRFFGKLQELWQFQDVSEEVWQEVLQ